ncbi:DUF3169 family protein [Staphylococcus simiae]|uniref:DUF3169 family protein n=1 Tax=Staphylococcus simiae TaxID=308354 RepID=UPI001A9723E0|nr:DUF3169 family protein [Staphylococcus simiae]MBO1198698.1 DUF3169 family protein [Staphylococcus simiae]MBO1200950.1 DUF3169 family protein [Staphylococcus simiae]MBO1203205.1 DUF3169 family protein [Staphylococcus simiae]MBO1210687.1 DUF3169 family protein [Staphylococcus simiae]MBO1229288.1 DUF3169 family protein [Staphylococcus simiae]
MKVVRYIVLLIIGGIVGGIFGLLISGEGIGFEKWQFATHNNVIIITIIATITIILLECIVLLFQRKALNYKKLVDNNEELDNVDEYELLANHYFFKANLLSNLQSSIPLIVLLIFTFGRGNFTSIVYFLIPFLLSSVLATQTMFFSRKFDSRMPKIGEKNSIEKRFAIMDEGERHITLLSLFKIFNVNVTLLFLAIVLIGFYSISTGINQSFSLLIVIAIFVYSLFNYLFKIQQYYKN